MDLISKYELIEKIVKTDDQVILQQVKHLLDEEEVESWDKLPAELTESIYRGLKQSAKRQVLPHSKVMKEIKKKYLKK